MKKIILSATIILSIVFFSIEMVIISLILTLDELGKEHVEEVQSFKELTEEELSFKDSLKLYIDELKIRYPDIVYRQAVIESENFTSRFFLENNNLFGMKQVYSRPSTQIGIDRGYGVYRNWKESVLDYAIYQAWSGKELDRDAYLDMLQKKYAIDKNYKEKLK
jgi:flagellum-specific peptidoglycan hydrolase FlgJ